MRDLAYRWRPHVRIRREIAEGGQTLQTTLTVNWYIAGLTVTVSRLRHRRSQR